MWQSCSTCEQSPVQPRRLADGPDSLSPARPATVGSSITDGSDVIAFSRGNCLRDQFVDGILRIPGVIEQGLPEFAGRQRVMQPVGAQQHHVARLREQVLLPLAGARHNDAAIHADALLRA